MNCVGVRRGIELGIRVRAVFFVVREYLSGKSFFVFRIKRLGLKLEKVIVVVFISVFLRGGCGEINDRIEFRVLVIVF